MKNLLHISTRDLLNFIIIIYPIFDIIFTINNKILNINLPVNQIARFLIMLLFYTKISDKRKKFLVIVLFFLFLIGEISYKYFNDFGFILEDFKYIFKMCFLVITIFAFEDMIKNNILRIMDVIKYIVLSSWWIIFSIFLSLIGFGFKSWGDYRYGYKGLFLVQNTITASLLIILPLSLYVYIETKKKKYLINYVCMILSLFMIGTKAGIIGAIFIFIIQQIYLLFRTKTNYYKLIILSFLPIILGIVLFLSKGFFKNFIEQQKYLLLAMYNNDFKSFILSNRNLQIMYIKSYINAMYSFKPTLLFGIGYSIANKIVNMGKSNFLAIEMDFYGIYYYSGVWILSIYIIIILKRIFLNLKLLFKSKFNLRYFCLFLSIIVGVVHSYYGGHVLYEALTILYFGSVLAIASLNY
ncbi:hypothetical protein SAMN05660865_00507 [Caloramator fervidus]|uniref:O-antigen ligase like membrane protein n=1 Tax=Caloramator fervidus TaxID=29344 RepID=A0A1H5SZC7_9CLOT|nr:O-antigen ligase family protein [Caloramator fervidus]SEF55896.1 hypothetical protein SAMN05660865_00507 [Caloramator fervidus]